MPSLNRIFNSVTRNTLIVLIGLSLFNESWSYSLVVVLLRHVIVVYLQMDDNI